MLPFHPLDMIVHALPNLSLPQSEGVVDDKRMTLMRGEARLGRVMSRERSSGWANMGKEGFSVDWRTAGLAEARRGRRGLTTAMAGEGRGETRRGWVGSGRGIRDDIMFHDEAKIKKKKTVRRLEQLESLSTDHS